MAAPAPDGKQPRFGPRHLATLVAPLTRPVLKTRGGALATLLMDWPQIVGPALAAVTSPLRLAGGTLTLACAGPVALELQHLCGPLAERINGHYGRVVVEQFRFVQKTIAAAAPAPPRPPPAPPVEIEGVPPGPLRDALARLGGAVAQACLTRGRQEGA